MESLELCGTLLSIATATGNRGLERTPLRLHPDVAVVAEHLPIHMAGDLHDGLVPCSTLRQLCDQSVAVVVPAAFDLRLGAHILPCRLERGHMSSWVRGPGLPPREDIPLILRLTKLLDVP